MTNSQKKLLVFDLDETLIYANKTKLDQPEDFKYQDYYVYKRPFLDIFLQKCSLHYFLAIWSSAEDEYVNQICKQLIFNDLNFEFIWARSHCWLKIANTKTDESDISRKEYQCIKPLEKIRRKGYKMKNLLIVDDSLYKVIDNPNNYVIIKAFEGDMTDNELLKFLKQLNIDFDI